jgi:hypothetical protein
LLDLYVMIEHTRVRSKRPDLKVERGWSRPCGVTRTSAPSLGKNSASFFEVWLGATKAGSAIAPFNWRSSPAELAELISDAQPPVVFVSDELKERLTEVSGRTRSSFLIVSDLDLWLAPHQADDMSLPALYHGARISILPFFEPTSTLRALATERATVICLVPDPGSNAGGHLSASCPLYERAWMACRRARRPRPRRGTPVALPGGIGR